MIRRSLITAALACLVGFAPTTARAELVDTIRAELEHHANSLPNPEVSLGAPSGTEAELGTDLQLLSVTYSPPAGEPLSGILVPPGFEPLTTTSIGKQTLWDFAVVEAAKHALATGASVDGVAISHADETGLPQLVVLQRIEPFEPPPEPASRLSSDEVLLQLRLALPAWAAAGTLSVEEDYAGERVGALRLSLPAASFAALAVEDLLPSLAAEQARLWDQGGHVGRVTVEVFDAASDEPLFVGAADSIYGVRVQWASPLVAGLIGSAPRTEPPEAPDVPEEPPAPPEPPPDPPEPPPSPTAPELPEPPSVPEPPPTP